MALKFISLGELLDNPPPPIRWLWGGGCIQECALTMLHGAEKSGKSLVLTNLAVAGAIGLPDYLGLPLREGGFRTLIVQGEIHLRGEYERLDAMVRAMVRALGIDIAYLRDRIHLNTERNVALLSQESWATFKRELREWKPDLVIIDPFAHVFQGDENNNQEVGEILQTRLGPLREPRGDYPGTTVVFAHHDGKLSEASYARSPAQRSRGANRLSADPDSIISLTKQKRHLGKHPVLRIDVESRYSEGIPPFRVRLNPETMWFEVWGEDTERLEKVTAAIELEENGIVTEEQLIELVEEHLDSSDKRHRKAIAFITQAVTNGALTAWKDPSTGTLRYKVAPAKEDE